MLINMTRAQLKPPTLAPVQCGGSDTRGRLRERHSAADSPRVKLLKISLCNVARSMEREEGKPKGWQPELKEGHE